MKIYYPVIILSLMGGNNLNAAECVYVPKQTPENPYPELSPQGKCGQLIAQDTFQLNDEHLNRLFFDKNGLGVIIHEGAIYYVSKSGKIVHIHFIDNGADYFVEGVARTIAGNKYGYINKELKVVIKTEYDFAFPFQNGVAIVCNGCRSVRDGEHKIVVGGKWGLISKTGQVVIPLKYGKNELSQSKEYNRITKQINMER